MIDRIEQGEPIRNLEYQYRRRSGEIFTALLSMAKVELNGERCLVGIITDISERKQAEEEIRRLNTELEQRVRERTAELDSSNQELRSFSYSISHDLRAPLRSIDGNSAILVEDYAQGLDDQARHFLDRIRESVQHMDRLIDALLNLSRLSSRPMERASLNLSRMAHEIFAELSNHEPARSVDLIIQDGLAATADRTLIKNVLENLLGNAWKFTSRRDLARIEFGRCLDEDKPAFFVRDNGAGFDPAYASKLFTAFQRLHRVNKAPGTGIGLATVKRIIQRHGGEVWAESAPDQGATFYFTLA